MTETLAAKPERIATPVGSVAAHDLMGLREMSRTVGIDEDTAREWADRGKVTSFRLFGRRVFIRPEIEALARERGRK